MPGDFVDHWVVEYWHDDEQRWVRVDPERGNAVRDLAALNKVEMLPRDEWGRMHASYERQTGDDYDELIDVVARACAAGDEAAVSAMYASEDLVVPASMRGASGGAEP